MVKKKIISMLVTAAMVIGMFPMIVSADEEPGTFTELQGLINTTVSGGTLTLDKNYTATEGDSCLVITKDITIDLNNKTLDRNLDEPDANGHVIKIENYGVLQIQGGGTITGGYAYNGGGIYVADGGQLKLVGGSVSYNRVASDGTDNSARGAGIYIEAGEEIGTNYNFFITGMVTNNTGARYGGGIYNAGRIQLAQTQGSSTTIAGNASTVAGGGIYNDGYAVMHFGMITSNQSEDGAGVYQTANGTLDLGNSIRINDSLYLADGAIINCVSSFDSVVTYSKLSVVYGGTLPVTITKDYGEYNRTGDEIKDPTQFFTTSMEGGKILLKDGEVLLTDKEEQNVAYKGITLTLGSNLGLNVFFDLSGLSAEQRESVQVTFDVPGRGHNVQNRTINDASQGTYEEKTYDKFTCTLSPIQMAEEVKVTLTAGDDITIEETISVEKYLQYFEEHKTDPEFAIYQSLVDAVSDYGYFSQKYLSIKNGWLIEKSDNGYAPITMHATEAESYVGRYTGVGTYCSRPEFECSIADTDIERVSYTINTKSSIDFELYFTMKANTTSAVTTCTVNGKEYTARRQSDGRYRLVIGGLLPQELITVLNISGNAGGSFSIKIAPLRYISSILALQDNSEKAQAAKTAAVSLFFYHIYTTEKYPVSDSGN